MTSSWTGFKQEKIIERIRFKKKNRLELGVSYLDDIFCGIETNDLILLSAYSGMGKTQLASHIAASNAIKGVKVHYFALEADEQEIQMRTSYSLAAKRYFDSTARPNIDVRYKLYSKGLIDPRFEKFADWGEKEAEKKFGDNFKILYRTASSFGLSDFVKELEEIDLETQLIIVDHLHYFDYDLGSEYRSISEITKKIRDATLFYNIPIILVTQLNRPERKAKRVVPDLDDIHGSSNLPKICTKAIFISKNTEVSCGVNKSPTLIRVAKFREEQASTNYVGLVDFNLQTNQYEDKYSLGILKDFDATYELVPKNKYPYWVNNGYK